jgi:hypothetical protein
MDGIFSETASSLSAVIRCSFHAMVMGTIHNALVWIKVAYPVLITGTINN